MKKTKKPVSPKSPKQTEVVYLGERVRMINDIVHSFRDAKGRVYAFKGIKNLWYGSSYYVDNGSTMKIKPERLGEKQKVFPTPQEYLEYQAHKEIVKHTRLKNRKKLELKKPHADIVKAIELLRPFTRHLDYISLDRFSGYLKNQLSKKAKKR